MAPTSRVTHKTISAESKKLSDNDVLFSVAFRKTIAEINAGSTLLPALPGFKYRVTDMRKIAVGGAAAAATTVDILATQAGASVELMASAVANLTQSAILRAGATGGDVLADGASFGSNDVNTAITAGKTGADLTTATHIDFFIEYVIERA